MGKIYYKVVKKDINGKLFSSNNESNLQVEYKINEWASPKIENTRLFVFESITTAKIFVQNMCEPDNPRIYEVYECQIIGGIRFYPGRWYGIYRDYWKAVNKFIKQKKSIDTDNFFIPIRISRPSVLAKKVKLIKRVY